MKQALALREQEIFQTNLDVINQKTDRAFGILMVVQFFAAVIWAAIRSPYTYDGARASIHPHLLTAIFLGLAIAGPVVALSFFQPGKTVTRICISIGQMLAGALLIHVSGGRIETHFHIFCSLAFLGFYRDWRLLIPAAAVVVLDHTIRGAINPMSAYGVSSGAEWRFLEHGAWVVCEVTVLIVACQYSLREMRTVASRQAELEEINGRIEQTIIERTSELKQAESRYGDVVSHAFDGIFYVDAAGRIQEINPSACQMFGLSPYASIGMSFQDLFEKASGALLASEMAHGNLNSQRWEWMAQTPVGETFPVEVSISPVQVEGGTALTVFVRDLTDQKQLEAKLGHAQKMESIGQMATGIAHEINTPNQYIGDNVRFVSDSWSQIEMLIQGYRNALSDQPEKAERIAALEQRADLEFLLDEAPSALSQALEGVQRVETIVRAMKEFAHPGGGMDHGVSLNKIIENAAVVSKNEWKYVTDLKLQLDPKLPYLKANQGELGQVILNLIVNAAHAIKEAGRDSMNGLITITTCMDGDRVLAEISDNGTGIPKEIRDRIFDPFFTTKGVGIGTGQGLAIAKSVIVERHGGNLTLDSSADGTTFRIRLPLEAAGEAAA